MTKLKIILATLALIVFLTSFFIRRSTCQKELKKISNEISLRLGVNSDFAPFLVESSMMYSYANAVACGKGIPKFDEKLTTLSNVPVNYQFSTALEYVLGYSYKIKVFFLGKGDFKKDNLKFEDNPDFSHWVRFNIAIWAASISLIIFLILKAYSMPNSYAFAGGMIHAVAPAAIARYTGQDIVRGNFALPFIVASIFWYIFYLKKPSFYKLIFLSFSIFVAMSSWDMTQIFLAFWGITEISRLIISKRLNSNSFSSKTLKSWISIFAGILVSALAIPYNQSHHLVASPLIFVVIPILFILIFFRNKSTKNRFLILIASMIVLSTAWKFFSDFSGFAGNYSHFASLLFAKIKFMNVKPLDPNLLDFNARSVWVPAMHSANKFIYSALFPMIMNILVVTLALALYLKPFGKSFQKHLSMLFFPLSMAILYSFLFFFIVRYHVFAIIFISILSPMLFLIWNKSIKYLNAQQIISTIVFLLASFSAYGIYFRYEKNCHFSLKMLFDSLKLPVYTLIFISIICIVAFFIQKIMKKSSPFSFFLKIALCSLLFCTFITELDGTLGSSRKYKSYFFPETAALIQWFRSEGNADNIIMADFNLSPLLKNYCNSNIILQPKFELGKTRELYHEFISLMFHGNEKKLAEFCAENNADYLVFDRGYSSSSGIYSPKYMAGASEVKKGTPAYEMNLVQDRGNLKNFYEIKPPSALELISTRYIVFKIISEKNKNNSKKFMKQAKKEWLSKNFELAARLVKAAVFANPNNPDAYLQYMQIYKKPPDITLKGF